MMINEPTPLKKTMKNYDDIRCWKEKLEAIRQNINVPQDVEPEPKFEEQNGIF